MEVPGINKPKTIKRKSENEDSKMKLSFRIIWIITGLILGQFFSFAQEEESAELYLEDYTDEFQEAFFEALKQKGIENYDKAINLFLDCKRLEPANTVVDYELAKVYLLEKNYVSALEYSLESVVSEPENYWYLNMLIDILRSQGRSADEVKDRIPYNNETLKENLALIYYKRRDYNNALEVLKELKNVSFADKLESKIKDSIDQVSRKAAEKKPEVQAEDPFGTYKLQLERLLSEQNYVQMEEMAAEALEMFPSQPYFYYMMGKALAMNNKNSEATKVLESALDFLLDETDLSNDIYRELSNAYRALGNLNKANMYLSKIKNGS